MQRVVTTGSIWIFDGAGRYQRMPREEQDRPIPEWGTTPGPLRDFEWHGYEGVAVREWPDGAHTLGIKISEPIDPDRPFLRTGPIVEGLEVAEALAEMWPIDLG